MHRGMFFAIIFILLASGPVLAQNMSGETEVGTDRKGGEFFSQYLFYDTKNINILARYFYVHNLIKRGEFAIGPTMKFNDNVLKLQFGGTTDSEVMLASTLSANIGGREFFYITDAKLSTRGGPYTLYQKLFVPLTKSGILQFRAEDLLVGGDQGFLRVGLEYRYNLSDTRHIFFAPFYDPFLKEFGGQFGLRFF